MVKFLCFLVIKVDVPTATFKGKFEQIIDVVYIPIFSGLDAGVRFKKNNSCVKFHIVRYFLFLL